MGGGPKSRFNDCLQQLNDKRRKEKKTYNSKRKNKNNEPHRKVALKKEFGIKKVK